MTLYIVIGVLLLVGAYLLVRHVHRNCHCVPSRPCDCNKQFSDTCHIVAVKRVRWGTSSHQVANVCSPCAAQLFEELKPMIAAGINWWTVEETFERGQAAARKKGE